MPNTWSQTMGWLYSLDCSAVATTVDVELHKYMYFML